MNNPDGRPWGTARGTALTGPASLQCAEPGCPWGRLGTGRSEWLANRAAALRHVQTSGHPVIASVVTTHTYSLRADGD